MPLVALLRLNAVAAAFVVFSMTWGAASAQAEGIVYAVPNEPPPAKESVDFTNHLNQRVRHLPESLNPPTTETAAQVEARVRTLERGVVVQATKVKGKSGSGKAAAHPGQAATKAGGEKAGHGSRASAGAADAPTPLTAAFVGAGVFATLGLLLSARGMRRHVRTG